jgi:hypothetical protein
VNLRRPVTIALIVIAVAAVLAGGALVYVQYVMPRSRTLDSVLARYGPAARAAWKPLLARKGVNYPPRRLAILVFKREQRVSIWAGNDNQPWRYIKTFPILAASGVAGPKLRQGDYQVPEGVYRIELLNPASSYHLSMKVDYPNAFDRRMAARDKRTNLGGDIFIHGKNVSIGCVAIGDPAIEQLFTLVADTGFQRVKVIMAPNDLRVRGAAVSESMPLWVGQLYRDVAAALAPFPVALESDSAFDVTGMSKAPKVFPIR